MKRRLLGTLLMLASTGAVAAVQAADASGSLSEGDVASIRAVIESYRTSWLRGDAEGVMKTFTEDAVLLPAHAAPPVIGTAAIRKYWWPSDGPPTTITTLDMTVEQVGGDCRIAYAHGRDTVAWTVQDKGVTRSYGHPGRYLNVLRKLSDGSWRISHHMWDDVPR